MRRSSVFWIAGCVAGVVLSSQSSQADVTQGRSGIAPPVRGASQPQGGIAPPVRGANQPQAAAPAQQVEDPQQAALSLLVAAGVSKDAADRILHEGDKQTKADVTKQTKLGVTGPPKNPQSFGTRRSSATLISPFKQKLSLQLTQKDVDFLLLQHRQGRHEITSLTESPS